jgi:hypothetical protein
MKWLDEEDCIKSMYTKYITYEKIMQCPSIKSLPLSYGGGFFFKK